ncbi:hypothetical protein ZWY2020_002835 [Hordeum vulgare]|nr:hypothetical protein ZWY2020_002835 [Hordeum vulgare]
MVSLDDQNVLCFMVHKIRYLMEDVDGDHVIRMIEVDTKRMELRSVICYDDGDDDFCSPRVHSCVISRYLDPSSRSSPSPSKRHEQAPTAAAATVYLKTSSDNKAAMASPGEMLATLRDIGDLAHDDMLRTYSVLAVMGASLSSDGWWASDQVLLYDLLGLARDGEHLIVQGLGRVKHEVRVAVAAVVLPAPGKIFLAAGGGVDHAEGPLVVVQQQAAAVIHESCRALSGRLCSVSVVKLHQ